MKKKDGELFLELERTQDILGTLGKAKKPGQFICGFSMETENTIENARGKLTKKNLDLIVANNVKTAGAGFGTETNVVTLIDAAGIQELPLMDKSDVADQLLSYILQKTSE